MKAIFTLLSAALLLFSCNKEDISISLFDDEQVHFQPTIETLVENHCISCHDSGSSLPLDDYNALQLTLLDGSLNGCLSDEINSDTEEHYYHRGFSTLNDTEKHQLQQWILEEGPQ